MQAQESMRRIDMILNAEQQSEAEKPKQKTGNDIVFENVTFSYENALNPAVKNLGFVVKEGTTTALVGPSGCGKSTTASLIPRFYDVTEGEIKIGGVDVRELSQADLMKNVAFVFQIRSSLRVFIRQHLCRAAGCQQRRSITCRTSGTM